jgi:hypothetical protein
MCPNQRNLCNLIVSVIVGFLTTASISSLVKPWKWGRMVALDRMCATDEEYALLSGGETCCTDRSASLPTDLECVSWTHPIQPKSLRSSWNQWLHRALAPFHTSECHDPHYNPELSRRHFCIQYRCASVSTSFFLSSKFIVA